jgi:iron complex transport system ATP-binding protein
MINVENLNQSYLKHGRRKTLDNINLTVRENCITALVGANGAGKSTLLGVMCGLLPRISGGVYIDGQDIRSIHSKDMAKRVAILKQTQHLTIRLTVNDLAEFGRFPHCGGRLRDTDRKKIDEALEYIDLKDQRGRYLDELSGGQRQRAFIAMILAQDTPYIFLDEPLNNLDIKYSVEMMRILKKLVSELSKTIIIVMHDINFAAAYADHITAMKQGRIIAEGTPEKMVTPCVLDEVFDYNFHITRYEGRSVCLYF